MQMGTFQQKEEKRPKQTRPLKTAWMKHKAIPGNSIMAALKVDFARSCEEALTEMIARSTASSHLRTFS